MSILDSDVGLWEQHTIKERLPDGSLKATLKDESYPPDWTENMISGRLVADSPREYIQSWHTFVKGRFDAWENRKAAAEASRASTPEGSGDREVESSGELGGGKDPTAQDSKGGETSVEAFLESKIATLSGFRASIEEQIAETIRSLEVLRNRRRDIAIEYRLAEKLYNAARNSGKRGPKVHAGDGGAVSGDDTSPDSPKEPAGSNQRRVSPRRGRPLGSRNRKIAEDSNN